MSLIDKISNLDQGVKEQMIIQWITNLCQSFVTDKDTWKKEHDEIDRRIQTQCHKLKLFHLTYTNGEYHYYNDLCYGNNIKKIYIPHNIYIDDIQNNDYYYSVNDSDNYFKNCCFYFCKYGKTIFIGLLINEQKKVCDKCLTEYCKHHKQCIII